MATLALSIAGQVVGGAIGGPIGATIGRAVGALAGSAIDNAIFAPEAVPTAPPADVQLMGSNEGDTIPRLYGWGRITGNIIWATELERQTTLDSGSKGTAEDSAADTGETYLASFAVGLCEGKIHHIGRIWADGRLLETEGLDLRVHKGGEGQSVNSLIESKHGSGKVPAYRGLAYLVFDGLSLKQFGNRIPNISVEICRVVGDLEPAIRAITIIPASTEYGYDPEPQVRVVGTGQTANENTHALRLTSNWSISISQLVDLCPNLKHVALVVAWFGDDLRADQCLIQPRHEALNRNIVDRTWTVSGKGRADVPVVTTHDGGPAYGGTPSDDTVLAAIADLKSRGLSVTLYPFLMMDIAEDNILTDPYTLNNGQGAYPWRGRITCDPAPNVAGSPDKTSIAHTQIDSFVGSASTSDFGASQNTVTFSGGNEWGYRRMVLHYANLCAMAGGVDAFLIGSEMRGLTQVRSSANSFPFVDALKSLAASVRTVVGSVTKITYAADWSEYHGLQPLDQPGDKLFNLDALWSDANIDAIGIDNYMPISDWRGTSDEPDDTSTASAFDLDYLTSNLNSGEGFDWYYANENDRAAGLRSPISDTVHSEPWVWRFKDIKSWWSTAHHNRINGVRAATATSWVAQSKPIWFTELGCGAIDKGSNQPNVFGDPKSSENAAPYFSSGQSDPLAQRQFLRAHHQFWLENGKYFDVANNPVSSIYSAPMLDHDRMFVWTWDARPFPTFPDRSDIWSDASIYEIGHWVSGRLGGFSGAEILDAMATDWSVDLFSSASGKSFLHGVQVSQVATLRQATSVAVRVVELEWSSSKDGLAAIDLDAGTLIDLDYQSLVTSQQPISSLTRSNASEHIGQLDFAFSSIRDDYQTKVASAFAQDGPVLKGSTSNLTLTPHIARQAAETDLALVRIRDQFEFLLPPSHEALELTDQIRIADVSANIFRVSALKTSNVIGVSAYAMPETHVLASQTPTSSRVTSEPVPAILPKILIAQLPDDAGDDGSTKLLIGAYADPWPASISLTDIETSELQATLTQPATMGTIVSSLAPWSPRYIDDLSQLEIEVFYGHIESQTVLEASQGLRKIAVQHDDGSWEVISYVDAELVANSTYVLSGLYRGLNSTHRSVSGQASEGNSFMFLGSGTVASQISAYELGNDLTLAVTASNAIVAMEPLEITLNRNIGLPESPVHAVAIRQLGSVDVNIKWHRRTRRNGDDWNGADVALDFSPERYHLKIFDGLTCVRDVELTTKYFLYSQTNQAADLGVAGETFTFEVAQVSTVLGDGHKTIGVFNG